MKKQNLKNLQLRKKSISNLKSLAPIVGGSGTCNYESKLICEEPGTGTACPTVLTGCQTFFSYCAC